MVSICGENLGGELGRRTWEEGARASKRSMKRRHTHRSNGGTTHKPPSRDGVERGTKLSIDAHTHSRD